jgi:hypothetical protein
MTCSSENRLGFMSIPYGQNNYRTLRASGVRRVAASPLTFYEESVDRI